MAADIPVIFDRNEFAAAKARQGVTYLPLRAVFEQCGATVAWQEQSKTIIATRADGAVLTLSAADNRATLRHNGSVAEPTMPAPVLTEGGKIYVPLRFVAENMLCQVDWRSGAVYIEPLFWVSNGVDRVPLWESPDKDKGGFRYFLNYADGALYEFDTRQSAAALLCTLPLSGYRLDDLDRYRFSLWLDKTANHNYIINAEIYDSDSALPSAFGYHYLYGWVAADRSKRVIVTADAPPQQAGDTVYLAGAEGLFAVDERTCQIRTIPADAFFGCTNLVWADERYALLQSQYGAEWLLADMSTGEIKDLTGELLSEENKNRLISIAELSPGSLADYWQNIGRWELLDPHPYMEFVGAEQGWLRFRLTAAYSWDENGNYKYIDIAYKLD